MAEYLNIGKSPEKLTKKQLLQELQRVNNSLDTERRCKNQAYYFILSRGLIRLFGDFVRHDKNVDWHQACVASLFVEALKK